MGQILSDEGDQEEARCLNCTLLMPAMNALISEPKELTPKTTWQETKWAWTSEEELVDHQTKTRLCAAALLPFRDRQPDWEGFATSIRWMQAAADHYGVELVTVLNADTGYDQMLRHMLAGDELIELTSGCKGAR